MKKVLIFLLVIASFMSGCSQIVKPKSSVNMQFYLVDRETKEEFLIVDISNNEFKVFEYDVAIKGVRLLKSEPVFFDGKQVRVKNDVRKYYDSLYLLMLANEDPKDPESKYITKIIDNSSDDRFNFELLIKNDKRYFSPNFSTGKSFIYENFHVNRSIMLLRENDDEKLLHEKEKFTYSNNKFHELWENKGNGFEFVEHVDFKE